jgi:hypothetical protein
MALLPKAAARVDAFLAERAAIRAAMPPEMARNIEARWAPVYGSGPNSAWERCVADVAVLGGTRDEMITYMYQERQQGRAL